MGSSWCAWLWLYMQWFILAARPHPKRVSPFVCADTRLGRCDLWLFDLRSYITRGTRGWLQIIKVPTMTLNTTEESIKRAGGERWEPDRTVHFTDKNIWVRKSHLPAAPEPTWLNILETMVTRNGVSRCLQLSVLYSLHKTHLTSENMLV